jgi:hypothetical protein
MEVKKVTKEMRESLRKPLPEEAVSAHPTKTYLSSIKAIYVTERLNDVFGVGSWTNECEVIDGSTSMVVVKVTLSIPEYGIRLESYGGNDNGGEASKNYDKGDAYKGAVTDAITKIGSFLEIGIDVFKGKQGKVKTQAQNVESDLPWLNEGTEPFDKVKDYLSKGGNFADVLKKYKVSKKVKEALGYGNS